MTRCSAPACVSAAVAGGTRERARPLFACGFTIRHKARTEGPPRRLGAGPAATACLAGMPSLRTRGISLARRTIFCYGGRAQRSCGRARRRAVLACPDDHGLPRRGDRTGDRGRPGAAGGLCSGRRPGSEHVLVGNGIERAEEWVIMLKL